MPRWAILARNGGVQGPSEAGFAVGVDWVYCFLSRREGDSEELVTTGGQPPNSRPNSGSSLGRLDSVGMRFLPIKILKYGFASGRETG